VPVWLSLILIAASLLTLAFLGIRVRGMLGALLVVQAGYWALGLLVRPLFLLALQPTPQRDDPLADSRFQIAGYVITLGNALQPVAVGLVIYVAIVLLATRFLPLPTAAKPFAINFGQCAIVLGLSWVFRLMTLRGAPSNLIDTVAMMGSVAAGAIILFSPKGLTWRPLALLALSELAWSALSASKTPILALALWVVMRMVAERRRVRPIAIAGLGVAAVAAFYLIQAVKVISGRLTSSDTYEGAYPWFVRPILPLLARFDAIQPNLDASFAGPFSWMSAPQAISQFLRSFVPQFLLADPKPLAGAQWGEVVRRMSVNTGAGANLAEGTFAEGWVLGGYAGVIIESVLLAIALLFVAWCLSRGSLYWRVLGLAMTSAPFLFERGMLGIGEGTGKSIQVALLAAVVLTVLGLVSARWTARRSRVALEARTHTDSAAPILPKLQPHMPPE